jgi:sarcosine oxidase subunit beta
MKLAGIDKLPLESHVLQAFVSESLKPFVDTVVTFGSGHLYMSQSDKGGLVFGGDIDGYNTYAQRGNLPIVEDVMSEMVAMFPGLARVRLLRSWGGIMDMTMDGSPIITTGPLPSMYLNCGWCYGGFKATPASGWAFAYTIARDHPHAINAAYTLDRFKRGILIDEKGQGATPRLH